MKPVYVIIDVKEKETFEKAWGIPYGYSECPRSHSFQSMMLYFDEMLNEKEQKRSVIEKHYLGFSEIVYKG